MKQTLMMMLLFVSTITIAQDSYRIVAQNVDNTNWEEVYGIIVLKGNQIDLSTNYYEAKIMIDMETYEDTIIDNNKVQVWKAYWVTDDQIVYITLLLTHSVDQTMVSLISETETIDFILKEF